MRDRRLSDRTQTGARLHRGWENRRPQHQAAISELQQTWAREDAAEWGRLHATVIPGYAAVIESVMRAQSEATGGEQAGAEAKRSANQAQPV
jgi:hypothetical protein